MLDEETVEYGVCLILAGFMRKSLPSVWDADFRAAKEKEAREGELIMFDKSLSVNGHEWLMLC